VSSWRQTYQLLGGLRRSKLSAAERL